MQQPQGLPLKYSSPRRKRSFKEGTKTTRLWPRCQLLPQMCGAFEPSFFNLTFLSTKSRGMIAQSNGTNKLSPDFSSSHGSAQYSQRSRAEYFIPCMLGLISRSPTEGAAEERCRQDGWHGAVLPSLSCRQLMTHSPHGSRTGSLQCCRLPSEWVGLGNRAVKELQMRKPRHCPGPSENCSQLLQGAQPAQPSTVFASALASLLPTSMFFHGMCHRLCMAPPGTVQSRGAHIPAASAV